MDPYPSRRALADIARPICAGLSLAFCGSLSLVYLVRPLGWDPLTIWPFWFWIWPGVVLGLLSLSHGSRPRNLAVVSTWLLALLIIPEEPRALLRTLVHRPDHAWQTARAQGRALRVISVNCAGGTVEMVEEALKLDPDLILVQEAPSSAELAAVADLEPGWQVTSSLGTAVIVRGSLTPLPAGRKALGHACLAEVLPARLKPPRNLMVASIHLGHPVLRTEFWLPEVRREARAVYRHRLAIMEHIGSMVRCRTVAGPIIVGGDFNTPGGDSLFRPLAPHLRDVFYEAGVGWPGTILNDLPISRIDQVWISPQLQAVTLRSLRTQHSDHRMVLCDLLLQRKSRTDIEGK